MRSFTLDLPATITHEEWIRLRDGVASFGTLCILDTIEQIREKVEGMPCKHPLGNPFDVHCHDIDRAAIYSILDEMKKDADNL